MNNIRIFIMKICYICCAIAMSYIAISCLSENKIIDRSSPVLIVNLDSTKVSEFRYSDIFKSVTAIELDEKDALLGVKCRFTRVNCLFWIAVLQKEFIYLIEKALL